MYGVVVVRLKLVLYASMDNHLTQGKDRTCALKSTLLYKNQFENCYGSVVLSVLQKWLSSFLFDRV